MKSIASSIVIVGLMSSGIASAATTNGVLNISANLVTACSVSVTDIAINTTTNPQATPTGTGSVDVTCANGSPYTIGLDAGAHYDSNNITRQMADNNNDIFPYMLFSDPNFSILWGDGGITINAPVVADTGTGVSQPHTVYATLGITSNVTPAGTYSDTVNVAINY